eukprot:TRINITY_DN29642_c0_g1_i1.p1 TRINITY_DN29642_c0_g1~~TRINITY_DN29642_c0_g1_i1.p1  ORF type:complete len:688 (+),score=137.65 TRINITY_DN29642_c0_g1_i1:94-2157(+)
MEQRESDLSVVCRLAHEHLQDAPAASRNDVLRRLPRDLRSGVEDIVKDIHSSIEVPPLFASSNSTLSFMYRKLVAYQTQHNHHQPPSRLQRGLSLVRDREATSCDNFHAKRVVCDLLKAWAASSPGCVSDEAFEPQEVEPYVNFLRHLLYYHDRWSARLFGSDNFIETIVTVLRKLEGLHRDTSDVKHKYLKILEQLHDSSAELLEHALRVTLLSVSENHDEFEKLCQREGSLTLKVLSNHSTRSHCSFWCTDFGQVVHSALIRADPAHFKPEGTGTPDAARHWSLWCDELGTVRTYQYPSLDEARFVFETCRCCTVLVGPEGKLDEKSFGSNNQMLSKVFQETSSLKQLNRRVDQHLELQRAAIGLSPPEAAPAMAIEDFLQEAAPGDADGNSEETGEVSRIWLEAVDRVRDRWQNQGHCDNTGIAEPFRGGKKVKWIEGVFEKESRASDFPTIILDMPKTFAELLACHVEVMSAVRGMISEGGSKEALAAIYALRQRSTITGQLSTCMERFLTSATLMHGFFEHLFFEGLANGKGMKGQVASMQRLCFESFRACAKLRDSILTQWHQLGLKVSDENLSEEAKRIDMTEKAAFCQLMGMPAPMLALGGAHRPQQALEFAESARPSVAEPADAVPAMPEVRNGVGPYAAEEAEVTEPASTYAKGSQALAAPDSQSSDSGDEVTSVFR